MTVFFQQILRQGAGADTDASMTNTHTDDAAATLEQIQRLADAGCDIIRCAVPDMAAAEGLKTICKESPIPVIADIHFDYKLALAAIEAGVDGLRLNPGNIGGEEKVRAVVEAAKKRTLPTCSWRVFLRSITFVHLLTCYILKGGKYCQR